MVNKQPGEFGKLNERLASGSESLAVELDSQFRRRLCQLVDQQLNEIYKRRVDPEDIVQSVLRSFFGRATKGEFHFDNPDALWGLLRRIARRKMLKRVDRERAAKRNIFQEEGASADPPEEPDEFNAHLLAEALDLALDGLGAPTPEIFRLQLYGYSVAEVIEIILQDLEPPYPQILQMRLEGKSEQEIAEELGCLRGKVRYRLERIQQRLAALLGNDAD